MASDNVEEKSDESCLEHLYCCGAATEVLKFGTRDLFHPRKTLVSSRVLILIIPGNPGVVGFYKTFMETIYQSLGRRCAVWAVSHAGHCTPPDTMDMVKDPSVLESGDVFGLNGQIEHKLAFLLEHVPRNVNLVLVGHSIGCYIILELMKRDPELKVLKSLLLFPTIERMAATPQGKVLTPVLCHLRYVLYLPIFLLCLLPESVITCVARLALRGVDRCTIPAVVSLLSTDCVANAMYMGSQEMRMVLDRDDSTIKKNLNKLLFYYGATDHWCPVQYYHDIKRDFPSGDFHLCERGIRHAFVLDAGADMAAMVTQWVSGDLKDL
ncbi:lipid droplet-associated hydrolase isoform X1 [Denticeps clupeoides]|nr:lipid droplet-associated hydrolase-like isoform X1 [Denticeps clupeoides]XP_028846947.1 lipid droplet-associated hydrolase-like isoform X1 [Denticeps clupeoides]XP_028846955.1 lipid droplet-associated hydrolase-like isoform X1 [Denticeps clupeoides]XP_028846964.1 lipid droplet-associated hydrolase-like isoform X1 [Denticeps clupeoides]